MMDRKHGIIFTEMDHRHSVVKRWGILHTVQQQSLAEHNHNVFRMAMRIAREWYFIEDPALLLEIAEWSIHHDNAEVLSNDFPAMAKPFFDESAFVSEHREYIEKPKAGDITREIVKLADKLEGLYFLCMEIALGNDYVTHHYNEEFRIINEWLKEHDIGEPVSDLALGQMYMWGSGLKSTRISKRGK